MSFSRPLVMSIINCTPDSFYPPSGTTEPAEAADKALAAESEGADIVDLGAESTRPGAHYLDEEEEIRRLIPALRLFRRQSALPVSVDTRKTAVARLALDEGANIINDISALADPAMISLCAERKPAVIVMHGLGKERPHSPPATPEGGKTDLIIEVDHFLRTAAEKAIAGGIEKDKIIIDPGFGFGKSTADNLVLLNRLARIGSGDYPLVIGLSRKRFIGEVTGRETEGRLAGTIAANAAAIFGGADIIRVHDTAEAVDTVKMVAAITQNGAKE